MQAHTHDSQLTDLSAIEARERVRLIGSGALLGLALALLVSALGGLGLL